MKKVHYLKFMQGKRCTVETIYGTYEGVYLSYELDIACSGFWCSKNPHFRGKKYFIPFGNINYLTVDD